MREAAALALVLACAVPAQAQTIYKCKGPDGRMSYSSQACAGDGEALPKGNESKPGAPRSAQAAFPPPPGAKRCDNGPLLKPVVAKLDSPATPDDVRAFLADERYRLLRCDYVRFTPEQRHARDAAMAEVDSRDPARRKAAMQRVISLYDAPAGSAPSR